VLQINVGATNQTQGQYAYTISGSFRKTFMVRRIK